MKIAGNILTVLVNTGESQSISVAVWGTILSQLGLYPLLSATCSFLRKWSLFHSYAWSNCRIHNWETTDIHLTRWLVPLRMINTLLLIPVILAIISGVWTAPDSNHIDTAYKLREAAAVLFILFVLVLFILATVMPNQSQQRRDKVLVQVYIVLPILFVRVIYASAQAFLSTPSSPGRNRWVYLGLLLIPDFVAVSIYTVFGFMVKKAMPSALMYEAQMAKPEGSEMGVQASQGHGYERAPPQGMGVTDGRRDFRQEGRHGQPGRRHRRRRGPIHMLYYAIAGRGE